MEKTTLTIEGMSCEHCVKAVSGIISEIAGVSDVLVDLKSKTASFSYDSAQTELDAVKKAIVEEGYGVAG